MIAPWIAIATAGADEGAARAAVEDLARQGADMAAVCESVPAVLEALRGLQAVLPADDREKAALVVDTVSNAVAPTSDLRIGLWQRGEDDFHMEMSVVSSLDAAGFIAAMGESGEDGPLIAPGPDGRMVLRDKDERPERPPVDARALASLGGAGGCFALMRLPQKDDFPGGNMALHLPLTTGEPLRFVLDAGDAFDVAGLGRATPTDLARTAARPSALLWLGLRLADFDPAALDLDRKQARGLRWLERRLPFDGLALAVFPGASGLPFGPGALPDVAVDLPLSEDWTPKQASRAVEKIVRKVSSKKTRLVVERDAPHHFVVHGKSEGPVAVHVLGSQGRVRLATNRSLLGDMDSPGGQPWVDEATQGHLFYVSVEPGLLPFLQAPEDTRLSFGFGVEDDGLVSGELALTGDAAELAAWMTRVQGLAKSFAGGGAEP